MEENKKIVDFPCKTCTHDTVCMYRSDLALLADSLKTPVKKYTSKDMFPDEIVTVTVGCKFYGPKYIPSTSWSNQPTCC